MLEPDKMSTQNAQVLISYARMLTLDRAREQKKQGLGSNREGDGV